MYFEVIYRNAYNQIDRTTTQSMTNGIVNDNISVIDLTTDECTVYIFFFYQLIYA